MYEKKGKALRMFGNHKSTKAPSIDSITVVMLKYSREIVTEWMHITCNSAWKEGWRPEKLDKSNIVPIY